MCSTIKWRFKLIMFGCRFCFPPENAKLLLMVHVFVPFRKLEVLIFLDNIFKSGMRWREAKNYAWFPWSDNSIWYILEICVWTQLNINLFIITQSIWSEWQWIHSASEERNGVGRHYVLSLVFINLLLLLLCSSLKKSKLILFRHIESEENEKV